MGMVRTLYSVSGLSVELAKDRRTISRALASVPPDGKVGAHPGWYLLTALQALGWIGRKSDGERLDAKQERARKNNRDPPQDGTRDARAGQGCGAEGRIGLRRRNRS